VVTTVAVLISRHGGLRTEFLVDEVPRQRVHSTGTFPISVYTVDPSELAANPTRLGEELTDALRREEQNDAVLRLAIATIGTTVHAAVRPIFTPCA
jgi:hypothetical protein